METIMLEVEAEVRQVVSYSESNVTHSYSIKNINAVYKDELEELISDSICGNGCVSLNCYNFRLYSAVYETTDSYEFDEDTALDIGKAINKAIATLAFKHGGYDAIKAE